MLIGQNSLANADQSAGCSRLNPTQMTDTGLKKNRQFFVK